MAPTTSSKQASAADHPSKLPLDEYVKWQEGKAWKGLLANIHPAGTAEGCIVASPSKKNPDYWYEWTRDSAIVMRTVLDAYLGGKTEYRHFIDEYIRGTEVMQHQETLIGGFSTGGLGEVKFMPEDHTPFMGEWSRPQNDGPAARVITIGKFARHLLEKGTEEEIEYVKTTLYDGKNPTMSVIKGDLEHIAKHWNDVGYDLWEEVSGSHFYTLLSIRTALLEGAELATSLSDSTAASYYRSTAAEISKVLPTFWSEEKGIIRVSLNQGPGRNSEENAHVGDPTYGKQSELDTATLLAVLHSGKGTEWDGNEKVFATLEQLNKAFLAVYPLNKGRKVAGSLGRYPEDEYDGTGLSLAHPWYLCTLSAAEILYKFSTSLSTLTKAVKVTSISQSWFRRFLPSISAGDSIQPNSDELKTVIAGQRALGDEFVRVVQEFSTVEGSLSEQFDRKTGEGRGARDLTWSYAAFITAAEARRA